MLMRVWIQRAGEKTPLNVYEVGAPPRIGERLWIAERDKSHVGLVLDVVHYVAPPHPSEVHVTITEQVTPP